MEARRMLFRRATKALLSLPAAASLQSCAPTLGAPPRPTSVAADGAVPTALQALEVATPLLRQRHPEGQVKQLAGNVERGYVRQWVLDVWAPERSRRYQYPVVAGVLQEAGTSSTIPPGGLPPIMTLRQTDQPRDLIDSPKAIELAAAAGAASFVRETGAELKTMALIGDLSGTIVWTLFYGKPLSMRDRLSVELDARTGAVTRYDDARVTATPTAARR